MTRKRKPTRKPAKRGQKDERRRAKGDPAATVNLTARRHAIRAAKREFDAAHARGLRSLQSRDLQELDQAIKDEAIAIKKLARVPLYRPAVYREKIQRLGPQDRLIRQKAATKVKTRRRNNRKLRA